MKFDVTAVYFALLRYAETKSDVVENPAKNKRLFLKLCQHFSLTTRNKIKQFQTNLYFVWLNNKYSFVSKVQKQFGVVKKLKNNNSSSKNIQINDNSDDDADELSQHLSFISISSEEAPIKKVLQDSTILEKKKADYQHLGMLEFPICEISQNDSISSSWLNHHLRLKLPQALNVSCYIIFSGFKFGKNGKFRSYAFCNQPKCEKKFKFHGLIIGLKAKIDIYSTLDPSSQHTLSLSYQLRGAQRQIVRQSLRNVKPNTFHNGLINKLDKELAKNQGNYQFTYSKEVIRKGKSEEMCKNDCHADDITDIILKDVRANGDHFYIRKFVPPFTIYLGIQEQIDLLKTNNDLILHFDATGSIIRKPYPDSKRIYYYAGVVNIQQKIYPVLEMITNNHTSLSISEFLIHFKDRCLKNNLAWPPFKSTITDWSWASINAVINAWNEVSVGEYLDFTYRIMFFDAPKPLNFMFHFTCYPHLMKMISRYLSSKKIGKPQLKVFLEAIAVLVHCHDVATFEKKIKSFFIILLSPNNNKYVATAWQDLSLNQSIDKNICLDELKFHEDLIFNDEQISNSVYQNSPFYKHFLIIKEKVKKQVGANKATNNMYHSTVFADYLMENLIPFLPFWSVILISEKNHYTNSSAENHFKQVKMEQYKNLKVGRFVDINGESVKAAYQQLNLNVPKVLKSKALNRVSEPDNLMSEEVWNRGSTKNRKRKSTYQSGHNIKKIVLENASFIILDENNNTVRNENYYYAPKVFRNYFVALTQKINDSYLIYLNGENYNTLYGEEWLDNTIIDYCANVTFKELTMNSTIAYTLCEQSCSILLKRSIVPNFLEHLKSYWCDKLTIFFPLNISGVHWILVYVDIKNKKIYYMDPMKCESGLPETMFKNFCYCWNRAFPGIKTQWTREFNKFPTQRDGFNCGIYVIHYMKEISKGNLKRIKEIDPMIMREELKKECIIKSTNTKDRCLVCGREETRRNKGWVMCNQCTKWTHYTCLSHIQKSMEEIENNNFIYECDLCIEWKLTHQPKH